MKLAFNELILQEFKGFIGEPQTLVLGRRPGLYYVRGVNRVEPRLGSNGSGKSSLWAALCWVLYGKTVDGLRNPDIQPWSDPKVTTAVVLRLSIDGKKHSIARTTHPNTLAVNEKAATSEAVEQLIGLNFEVFTNTVLLGQGRPLFFDLPPAGKMQLFTDVLDLEKWEQRSKEASDVVKLLDQDLAAAEGELTGVQGSLDQIKALFTSTEQALEAWEKERKARVASFDKDRAAAQRTLSSVEKKLGEAQLAYDGAATELKDIYRKREAAADKLDDLQRDRDARAIQKENTQRLVNQLRTKLTGINETGNCPACGQSLGTGLRKHKAELRAELAEAEDLVKSYGLPEKLTKQIAEGVRVVAQYRTDAEKFDATANRALQDINLYQPTVAEQKQRIRELENQAKAWEEEGNPHRQTLSDLRKKRTKLGLDVEALNTEIDKLTQRIERTRFWVKGFKDVRLYIIEQVLQELELTTNATLEDMGLYGWTVSYAIEKETKAGTISRGLNTTILSPANREPVRWEAWSGGEGQRLRVAGALALSEVLLHYAGVEVDTEILDEPTAHLSGEGVRDLCEALADRARALGKRIFYVDHQSVEGATFASVITVTKTKLGSTLEG